MARSSCATTYHDGMVFHAAFDGDAVNTLLLRGFCVAAITLASVAETSFANTSRNCARSMYRKPAVSGLSVATSGGVGYLSPNAPICSPASGAKAERYT